MFLGILVIVLGVILAGVIAIGITWLAIALVGEELGLLAAIPAFFIFLIMCRGAFLLGGSLY